MATMASSVQDLKPDLEGGAFSSWTEMTAQNQTGKVQSVNASGTLEWTSAVEVSASENHFRVSPRLAQTDDSSGVFVVWGESDGAQINRGIMAQKIDTSGFRLWGDGGFAVEPLGLSSFLDLQADRMDHDLLLGYIKQNSFGATDIFASRLDANGTFIWDGERVSVTNSAIPKSDLQISRGPDCAFLTWSEGGEIKAHCLKGDGSLGIPGETPADTLNYFPLVVGTRWSYASTLDSTYITVVDSHTMGIDQYYDIDAWYPDESINSFHYTGVQVLVNSGAADQLLYDFAADLNDSWMFQFPGSDISEITVSSIGDTIETELGTYTNCMGFHRFIAADYEYYDWFAPDIGLVQRDVVTIAGPRRYQLYSIDQVPVGIDDSPESRPGGFYLKQNYPNPFNPRTRIEYVLPERTDLSVIIYDVQGTQVIELHRGVQEAGAYTLEWRGNDESGTVMAAGLYVCQVLGPGFTQTIKMLYLK